MKLISYRLDGKESWGAVVAGQVLDLATVTGLPSLADFLASPAYDRRDSLVQGLTPVAAVDGVEFLPLIPRAEKIICAVRNYMDHHNEAVGAGLKAELSEYPPIFLRVWRSLTAHEGPILRPQVSASLDWEGELAVVIGRGGRDIPEARAYEHVAGYSCFNDGSIREWQFHAKQIAAGKNFESTGGLGPWLVTSDEIGPEPQLDLTVRLNGEVMQRGNTRDMIFGIPRLIHYASTIFTLSPGDVIATGTPAGVGFSRKPPRFMKAGDICEVEIESIGTLRNRVVDA